MSGRLDRRLQRFLPPTRGQQIRRPFRKHDVLFAGRSLRQLPGCRVSALIGSAVKSAGIAGASAVLTRAAANAAVSAAVSYGQAKVLNSWDDQRNDPTIAAVLGFAGGALGSLVGDGATSLTQKLTQRSVPLTAGQVNFIWYMQDLNRITPAEYTPAAVAAGEFWGNLAGNFTCFVPTDQDPGKK